MVILLPSPPMRIGMTAMLLALLAPAALAGEPASDPFAVFREEAAVVTAARRAQTPRESPVAVDVITAEELRVSGVVNWWDALRFRPGLDIVDGRAVAGANRVVLSVRGLVQDLIPELQVLIDGRSVYSPVSGGVLWEQIPVQLQDIERIEIVRGPNAALFGSSAGLGVINVITKKARRDQAAVRVTGGSLDTKIVESAVERAGGPLDLRLSHTWRTQEGYPAVKGGDGNDFLQSNKVLLRSRWTPDPDATLDAWAGGSWDSFGKPVDNNPRGIFQTHFQQLRLSRRWGDSSTFELGAARNDQTADQPATPGSKPSNRRSNTRYYQYDVEALHSFGALDDRLHTTWGGNWRYSAAESNRVFGPGLRLHRITRGFAHQTLRPFERLSLVAGVSAESTEIGQDHADWQVAAVGTPGDGHALRVSYSVAHNNPALTHRHINLALDNNASIAGNPKIKTYELKSYEAGYRAESRPLGLVFDAAFFYTRVRDQVKTYEDDYPSLTYVNRNYIVARGAELSLKWTPRPGTWAYVNSTHEVITDRDAHLLLTQTTPEHKLNLGGAVAFGPGLSASANAGYKSGYMADVLSSNPEQGIFPFWRLDARLAWSTRPGFELFVSGLNLIKARQQEFVDRLTVPRVFYGGVTLRFEP